MKGRSSSRAGVDHRMASNQLTAIGRDVECVTLARPVRWHVEHRIVLNGCKTVVFSWKFRLPPRTLVAADRQVRGVVTCDGGFMRFAKLRRITS